jgi:hypothetical protein
MPFGGQGVGRHAQGRWEEAPPGAPRGWREFSHPRDSGPAWHGPCGRHGWPRRVSQSLCTSLGPSGLGPQDSNPTPLQARGRRSEMTEGRRARGLHPPGPSSTGPGATEPPDTPDPATSSRGKAPVGPNPRLHPIWRGARLCPGAPAADNGSPSDPVTRGDRAGGAEPAPGGRPAPPPAHAPRRRAGRRAMRHRPRPLSRAEVDSLATTLASQLQLLHDLEAERRGLHLRLAALSLLHR